MNGTTTITNGQAMPAWGRLGPWYLIVSAGLALMVTTAAAFIDAGIARPGDPHYAASGFVMTPVDLLLALGFAAMASASAVSAGWLKKTAFALLIGGSLVMVPAEALLRVDFGLGNVIFGIAGPLQALGMILAGIGVIRTGRWSSWRRFALVAMGLYIPLVMMPWLILGHGTGLLPLAGYHLFVLLIGIAYLVEDQAYARAPFPS